MLEGEYQAALHRTTSADLFLLQSAGVGESGLAVGPAIAPIQLSRGLFQFDPDGDAMACIVPVRVDNALSPEAADPILTVREGDIVDLVAFSIAYPMRWALRTGAATWLGAVEPQFLMPDPVPVWRTPLHWLGNECRGLVLLTREQYRVLTVCDTILAEDEGHARDLRKLLQHPWLAPPVLVRRGREVRNVA